MDQAKPLISIQCPEHKCQTIGILDINCSAKKLGYCYECMIESHTKDVLPKTMRTIADYLKDTSDFYSRCRQRVNNAGEAPAEYVEELAKKAERLEMLSKHVDKEKSKVKGRFDEIRKNVLEIIDLKEKECIRLLEEEVSGLSDLYTQYEKLLVTGWLKFSDIDAIYPTSDALEQRISKIVNLDQLQAFVKGVVEDTQIENLYCDGKDGLQRRKDMIDQLSSCFQKIESSLPEVKSQLLNSEDLGSLMKKLLKEFNEQEIGIENSIASRMKEPLCESQIINYKQSEVLRSFLPNSDRLHLKLLYRGSTDGMSSQIFHQQCDAQGATVTLIQCRFNGASSSSVLGGFIDESWHSESRYSDSKRAFLFSLSSATSPVKCPIIESSSQFAFYGNLNFGPRFGGGHDLWIENDFKKGRITFNSYSNAASLCWNEESTFDVEEVEVFHVEY